MKYLKLIWLILTEKFKVRHEETDEDYSRRQW